ncbi:hypothetical protein EPN18_09070 [bacterium]|nr:MAG: hypothetical protein EPN18_09070 [bacterium]
MTDADRARIKAQVEELNKLDEERREQEFIKNNTPRWEREAKEKAEKAEKQKVDSQKASDMIKKMNAELEASKVSVFSKAFMYVGKLVFYDALNAVIPESFYDFDKTPMMK